MALLDLPLREFLDEVGADGRTPGAGSAAALVTAIAAGLLAKVARASGAAWPDAAGNAGPAASLRSPSAPPVQAGAPHDRNAPPHRRADAPGAGVAVGR